MPMLSAERDDVGHRGDQAVEPLAVVHGAARPGGHPALDRRHDLRITPEVVAKLLDEATVPQRPPNGNYTERRVMSFYARSPLRYSDGRPVPDPRPSTPPRADAWPALHPGMPVEKVAVRLGYGRAITASAGEPSGQLRARRAVAHPEVEVDGWQWEECTGRGLRGGYALFVKVFVPQDVLEDLDRDVGDAGGAGDRLVAQVAREVTGLDTAKDVAHAVGLNYCLEPEDVWRLFGIHESDAFPGALREEVKRRLGLVEPPLPEWVKPGARTSNPSDWFGHTETIERVDGHGVWLDGKKEPIQVGWFVVGWREMKEGDDG